MQQKINDFNVILTKIVVAHKWIYDTATVYGYPNGRKSYGLIYLLSGELKYQFSNGKYLQAKAGDFILLKPEDCYKVTCPKTCEHFTVNFQILPTSIEGKIAKKILLSTKTAVIRESNSPPAQIDLFEELCSVWKKKEPGYQMQALLLTYKLLNGFIKKHVPLYNDASYTKLAPAITLLESAWNKPLSLATLAGACNLSIPHFRHLFVSTFKTSPICYRNSLRLLYAKDYLLREGYSVTDVAVKCGFEDINYFSRFFKKHTGVSPTKYATS